MIVDAVRVFFLTRKSRREFSSPPPRVRFSVRHNGATERTIVPKTDWACSIYILRPAALGKAHADAS